MGTVILFPRGMSFLLYPLALPTATKLHPPIGDGRVHEEPGCRRSGSARASRSATAARSATKAEKADSRPSASRSRRIEDG